MQITELRPDRRYRVHSETSGSVYEVYRAITATDTPGRWECDCPGYQWGHGRECKHIKGVRFWRQQREENHGK